MKLLLDENISYRVQRSVQEVFPGTCHVSAIQGLKGDKAIWEHARAHDLVLVTFDHDFVQLAALYGFPPKVLLLTLRNPRYAAIASLLIMKQQQILDFVQETEEGSSAVMELA
ncbi:MAG: DUF5615 family PIN-like protein [Flavobacteriales bacterium]|nr:hypothetical protein [Flavobacteriales bacterium]MCC6578230.1 DUF5615 family PIN-like protein [Flavobacteriales bacterium]NUQ14327.1 DUF5615 family PIN-like protein [Flavobacteriales bacterium]